MRNICFGSLSGLTTAPYPRSTELLVQHMQRRNEMRDFGGRLLVKASLKLSFVDHAFVFIYDYPYLYFFLFFFVLVLFVFSHYLIFSFPFLSLLLHQCCILHL